jgi:hypothetical protein
VGSVDGLVILCGFFFRWTIVPMVFANPGNHIAWGSNAYSLAVAGAVWIFASSIRSHWQREHDASSDLAEVV